MKLVAGETLERSSSSRAGERDGWSPTRALGVLLQVCEAMAYAHARGVIHRDLKPANVMVGRFGEVYVMDWGLAKRILDEPNGRDVQDPMSATSRRGPLRATAPRGAPRGADLAPLVTMDGDVSARRLHVARAGRGAAGRDRRARGRLRVGAMLYHLLAGRRPYRGHGRLDTAVGGAQAVLEGPPSPSRPRAARARELVAICAKAMARERPSALPDHGGWRADLRAFLEGRVVRAHRTGPVVELSSGSAATAAGERPAALVVGFGWLGSTAWLLRSKATELLEMSDHKRIADLVAEDEALWPIAPERAAGLRAWVDEARKLRERLPLHRALLARLERVGRRDPEREAAWAAECAAHDEACREQEEVVERRRADLRAARPGGERPDAVDLAYARLVGHELLLAGLRSDAPERPLPEFSDDGDAWQYESTHALVRALGELTDERDGRLADVLRRLELAETLRYDSLDSSAARRAWERALDSIADERECPAYRGLRLEPIPGLLPIGRDPTSGLWEFAHLLSGEPAQRDASDQLVTSGASGVVLVLLPGGNVQLGAQKLDPALPLYHPVVEPENEPLRQVTVEPFLISKFELTQRQWKRMGAEDHSHFTFSDLHPVNMISWNDCLQWLPPRRTLLAHPRPMGVRGAWGSRRALGRGHGARESLRARQRRRSHAHPDGRCRPRRGRRAVE